MSQFVKQKTKRYQYKDPNAKYEYNNAMQLKHQEKRKLSQQQQALNKEAQIAKLKQKQNDIRTRKTMNLLRKKHQKQQNPFKQARIQMKSVRHIQANQQQRNPGRSDIHLRNQQPRVHQHKQINFGSTHIHLQNQQQHRPQTRLLQTTQQRHPAPTQQQQRQPGPKQQHQQQRHPAPKPQQQGPPVPKQQQQQRHQGPPAPKQQQRQQGQQGQQRQQRQQGPPVPKPQQQGQQQQQRHQGPPVPKPQQQQQQRHQGPPAPKPQQQQQQGPPVPKPQQQRQHQKQTPAKKQQQQRAPGKKQQRPPAEKKNETIIDDDINMICRIDDKIDVFEQDGIVTVGAPLVIDESDDEKYDIVQVTSAANFRERLKYLMCDGKTSKCTNKFLTELFSDIQSLHSRDKKNDYLSISDICLLNNAKFFVANCLIADQDPR